MNRPPILVPRSGRAAPWRTAGLLASLVALALVVDPNRPLPIELCVLKQWTGWSCPTCGLTRAICFALRGEWLASVRLHPAGPVGAVALVGWMIRAASAGWRGASRRRVSARMSA